MTYNVLLIGSKAGISGDYSYVLDLIKNTPSEFRLMHYSNTPLKVIKEVYSLGSFNLPLFILLDKKELSNFDILHIIGWRLKLPPIQIPIIWTGSGVGYHLLAERIGVTLTKLTLFPLSFALQSSKYIYPLYNANKFGVTLTLWSEYAKNLASKVTGIPLTKIKVIPPAVNLHNKKVKNNDVCRLLFIGLNFHRKGGEALIRAFRQVRYDLKEKVELTIVTSVFSNSFNKIEGVKVYPPLPRKKLFTELYPESDVYILPSNVEGFGLSVLEAMSFGLSIIASNISAIPEMVEHGKNGFLIKPKDYKKLALSF